MLSGCCLDELTADANAVAGLPQAALDHVAHPELAGDLLRVGSLALVTKACISSDDGEPACTRQLGDHILGNTVEKELGLGITAEVLKWQHGDRRFVWWCCASLPDHARRRGRPLFQDDAEDAYRARDVLDLVLS